MYSVDASKKTAKLKKAYVVNASKKTEKLKKCYVVDVNKKLVKLWSGNLCKFLFSGYVSLLSSDGLSYEKVEIARPQWFDDIIFANGKYWGAYTNYQTAKIYCSEDGINWTLTATIYDSSKTYFGSQMVLRYQNGVFILGGEYSESYSSMAYSMDGITWELIPRFTFTETHYYYGRPLDIRYGTVDGVTGWYLLVRDTKYGISELYVFKSLDDIKAGTPTYLACVDNSCEYNLGVMTIRNNRAYFVLNRNAGSPSSENNIASMFSYSSGKITTIQRIFGDTISTIWSTDKYLIYRGLYYTQYSATTNQPTYNYETGEYLQAGLGSGNKFRMGYTGGDLHTGVFVNGRMYQLRIDDRGYQTYNFYIVGAYSDDYGKTVTQFEVTVDTTVNAQDHCLVYGDDGGGFYQEQY